MTELAIQKIKDDAEVAIQGIQKAERENKEGPSATAAQGGKRGNHGLRGPSIFEATVKTRKQTFRAPSVAYIADAITTMEIPAGKVRIEVFRGPTVELLHTGMVYNVEPLGRAAAEACCCKIGRSKCKQVKKYGVSLYMDKEASFKHGTLTRVGMDYYYKDVGSANGTFDAASGRLYDKLVPYNPDNGYKLENGTRFLIGRSVLQFNFAA